MANDYKINEMTDAQLAEWQSGWKSDTHHYILANREWERRLIAHQAKIQFANDAEIARLTRINTLLAATVGVAGAVIGALVAYYLATQ